MRTANSREESYWRRRLFDQNIGIQLKGGRGEETFVPFVTMRRKKEEEEELIVQW